MTDELDTLTDTQLSEAFAVEVAGWTKNVHEGCDVIPYGYVDWEDAEGKTHDKYPTFATDANAVLPWMERAHCLASYLVVAEIGLRWTVGTIVVTKTLDMIEGVAETLPRAACIALIRAKRKELK